jgi:nuclear factor erythroid 2, invertebrate
MEQRWQDLANLLSFPPAMGMGTMGDMSSHAAAAAAHYSPHHYPYQVNWTIKLTKAYFYWQFFYSQAGSAMSQHSQFSHHHHHPHSHPAVLHNASLAEIASQPASSHHYSSNLGSAVASSMHLTNSTSETDAGNSTYKMEHDMMYYSVSFDESFVLPTASDFLFGQQTNPSEMNHTNDGFLNSILNDEDLQLMDMAVNEGEFKSQLFLIESSSR